MIAYFCLVLAFLGQFPGQRRTPDVGTINSSWISGRVTWKSGDPVPLATVTVSLREYDNGRNTPYPDAMMHPKPNGTFRLNVPSDATYQVCAEVPGHGKQCKEVKVEGQDLGIADFAF